MDIRKLLTIRVYQSIANIIRQPNVSVLKLTLNLTHSISTSSNSGKHSTKAIAETKNAIIKIFIIAIEKFFCTIPNESIITLDVINIWVYKILAKIKEQSIKRKAQVEIDLCLLQII